MRSLPQRMNQIMPPMSNKAKIMPTQVQILRFLDHFLRAFLGGFCADFLVFSRVGSMGLVFTSSPVSSSKSKARVGSRKSSVMSARDFFGVESSGGAIVAAFLVRRGGMKSSGWMVSAVAEEATEESEFEEALRRVWRGWTRGVKPLARAEEAGLFGRRGESPSIDFLVAIVYNYSI